MYFIFLNDWKKNSEPSQNFSIFAFDLYECDLDYGIEITILGFGIGVVFIKGFNNLEL